MTTRVARTTLTIKLTSGKDDDLLAWLAALPKGSRQGAAKRLLRSSIQHEGIEPTVEERLLRISQDTAWLRAALSEMPSWMEGLLSQIAVVKPIEDVVADTKIAHSGQLSTEGFVRRENCIAKAAW